jgi:hypothetical protein
LAISIWHLAFGKKPRLFSFCNGEKMSLVIALIFVLVIANNIWMERRISALERRWNGCLDKQTQEFSRATGFEFGLVANC